MSKSIAAMRIKAEQLHTFLMVASAGGIRRASARMNLSQPAVTARIKNLEDALGVALFERSSGGMQLTKAGDRLIRYAEQLLHLNELIDREIADPAAIDTSLRIGVSETIVQSWLPDFIARLHTAYPRLEVEIAVDISVNLREALLERAIDLAILMGPVSEYTVDNIDLPAFPLRWYAAADAALPDDPAELFRRHPCVTYARSTRPYRELKAALADRYGPGISLFPSSSLSACFRMVAAGLGVGALPSAIAGSTLLEGRIRSFDPGWHPNALQFTASYLAEPQSFVTKHAAELAREVAVRASDRKG
ncbi:MAG: LysR family transcriptional regulator [Alphaproteobacteria bacterium]